MLVAAARFALMSVLVKHASGTFSPAELVFYRSAFGLVAIWVVIGARYRRLLAPLATPHFKAHFWRGLSGFAALVLGHKEPKNRHQANTKKRFHGIPNSILPKTTLNRTRALNGNGGGQVKRRPVCAANLIVTEPAGLVVGKVWELPRAGGSRSG